MKSGAVEFLTKPFREQDCSMRFGARLIVTEGPRKKGQIGELRERYKTLVFVSVKS